MNGYRKSRRRFRSMWLWGAGLLALILSAAGLYAASVNANGDRLSHAGLILGGGRAQNAQNTVLAGRLASTPLPRMQAANGTVLTGAVQVFSPDRAASGEWTQYR